MQIQDYKSRRGLQYSYGQIWEKILGNMKEEYNQISAEKILHEADHGIKCRTSACLRTFRARSDG